MHRVRLGLLPWAAALLAALVAPRPGAAAISAERVLDGLSSPVFVTAAPGDPRLFIVQLGGTVVIYDDGQVLPTPFLDVTVNGEFNLTGEGGLLSIAFPPDFSFSAGDYVYAYYSADPQGGGDPAPEMSMRLSRFRLLSGMETVRADESTEEVLYSIDKVPTNHNGGTIAFRGDWLYLGLGDGGGPGDPDDLAQDDGSDFGKMLRFDTTQALPWTAQHWAKGLRNPFRWSFDRMTGDLYIGDVGQNAEEEIDVQPATVTTPGENFGWDIHEGDACFDPDPGELPCDDPSLTFPIHRYDQIGGSNCNAGGSGSVTGGAVYRGSAIPEFQGHYLFADFCTDEIWSLEWDGAGGTVAGAVSRTAELVPDQGSIESIVAIGEDDAGELYIVDLGGEIFRVPEPGASATAAAALTALLTLGRRRRPRVVRSGAGAATRRVH